MPKTNRYIITGIYYKKSVNDYTRNLRIYQFNRLHIFMKKTSFLCCSNILFPDFNSDTFQNVRILSLNDLILEKRSYCFIKVHQYNTSSEKLFQKVLQQLEFFKNGYFYSQTYAKTYFGILHPPSTHTHSKTVNLNMHWHKQICLTSDVYRISRILDYQEDLFCLSHP